MKAVLALIVIYVGTFLVAIQGASQSSVRAASQNSAAAQDPASPGQAKAIDPVKEADIRSLIELIGVRDQVQESIGNSAEQYREKLLATVPNNDKGQEFVNAWAAAYQKKFDVDQVMEQLVMVYDKHYSEDDIKSLLQFYGSPVGQKVAAEMPKIGREIQVAAREAGTKAAREALQTVKSQNPDVGQSARLGIGQQRRWPQQRGQAQSQPQGQTQAQSDTQPQ
jgi:hypothetical protein